MLQHIVKLKPSGTRMSTYDPAFFKYINNGSTSSAAAIIPLIKLYFNVQSVVDFGFGQGAWLREWKKQGAREVLERVFS